VPIVSAVVETATTGLRGYVVVDSLVGGRAMGGTRMTPTVSPRELAGLARQMTLKLALAGLPIGGAKAGIVAAHTTGSQREAQVRSFGRAVAPLLHGGIYLGTDQGVTYSDRAAMFDAAGYRIESTDPGRRLPCTWADLWDRCAGVTGHGVAEAAMVAVEQLGLATGRPPRVAIQGFGTVGRGTAKRLAAAGYRIVGVADHLGTLSAPGGLPLDTILAATDKAGTIDRSLVPRDVLRSSAPDAWLDVDADVLVLAAVGHAVRADNVARVRAAVVVEGANEPCTDEAIAALAVLGVPVVPGIVANCGGAMVTGLVLTGGVPATDEAAILCAWLHDRVATHVRGVLLDLFEVSRGDGRSLPDLAVHMAEERAIAATAGPGATPTTEPAEPATLTSLSTVPTTPSI
jgi:glutamate dehydrogenase (NAD(P)+)